VVVKFVDDAVSQAAGMPFQAPRLERVARKQAIYLAGTVLLAVAGWEADGFLGIALSTWAFCRLLGYLVLGLAGRASRERQRRLDALPSVWLRFLRDGGEVPDWGRVRVTGGALDYEQLGRAMAAKRFRR